MRELITCHKHGVRWAEGDRPCNECRKQDENRNKEMERLRTPKTKSGRVWRVKGDEDYGK